MPRLEVLPTCTNCVVRAYGGFRGDPFFILCVPGLSHFGLIRYPNVVLWLGRRRSLHPVVCALVAATERLKYEYMLKVSVRFASRNEPCNESLITMALVFAHAWEC